MSECGAAIVPDETHNVTVRFRKPLRTRIAETWNERENCFIIIFCGIPFMTVPIIACGFIWMLSYCHQEPDMKLESLSIRDMAVYQNTTSMAWQVDSAFNVTLLTSNPNTVAGCFTTYRRVIVRVQYKPQTILQQEVPLGFGLKPRRSRSVTMELQAQEVQLQKPDRGPALKADLRLRRVMLDIFFDARYLRNDRKARWVHFRCLHHATTPSNSSSNFTAIPSLLKFCFPT